jgi:multiple sugar transport system permease protein
MLSPVILFNLIMGLIGSFQYFTQVYVMAGARPLGSPQDSTLVYAIQMFSAAFLDFRMGYSCAMAWILFLITLACALVIFRTSARWVYYGSQ